MDPVANIPSATSAPAGAPGAGEPKFKSLTLDHYTAGTMLQDHALTLGVSQEAVRQVEIERGRAIDGRVDQAQLEAIKDIYEKSQIRFLASVSDRRNSVWPPVLFAPTSRVVDYAVDEQVVPILAARLIREGHEVELRRAICDGPAAGGVVWDRPKSELELVASLYRWACLGAGGKKRLRPPDPIRNWVAQTLEEAQYQPRALLGGVSAVGSALSLVLGRPATMMALGKLPPDVKKHLEPAVAVVSDDPAHQTLQDLPLEQQSAGHYCVNVKERQIPFPAQGELLVNGQVVEQGKSRSFDIIVSGSSVVNGFGSLEQARLASLGQSHAGMVLSGIQALSTAGEIHGFFEAVSAFRAAGAPVALLYAESKFPDKESLVWKELRDRRAVEYLSMNAGESFDVLARLLDAARAGNPLALNESQTGRLEELVSRGRGEQPPWENGPEAPVWMLNCALLMQELLKVPVLRVRGRDADITVVDQAVTVADPRAVRDHLTVSRLMGTLKAANDTGLIDHKDELAFVQNNPPGRALAALQILADAAAQYGGDKGLATTCMTKLADGRLCFAVPPVPFYDRSGGTQSAGDTIDVTFALEEMDGLLRAARAVNAETRSPEGQQSPL